MCRKARLDTKRQIFVDYDRLEHDLSNPQTSLMIFCNPHNPCGIIWTKDELAKIGALCRKYNVTVISDEIHCDITAPGNHTCRLRQHQRTALI